MLHYVGVGQDGGGNVMNEEFLILCLFNNSSFFDFSLTHKIRVGLGAMNQGVSIYHGKMTQIFDCYDESNSELR